jgi:hypothetical protein
LKRKRSHHACASIKDNNDQVTKVLVVGGWDDVDLNSTEILDLDRMKFVDGPDLPTAIESPSVVVGKPGISSSSVYIIGGYSKTNKLAGTQLSTIYFSSSDFEGWKLIGHTSRKRTLFTAFALPSNSFPNCDLLTG